MSNTKEKQIEWRRNKVYNYLVKGVTKSEIAELLQVSNATITKDIAYLRKEAREQIQTHIQERIPLGYNQCISGLDEILKNAWLIASKGEHEKTKLQALTLANECYRHKMDLITNGVVIDDALKFVNEHKHNIKLNEIDTESDFKTVNNTVF
jgi:hypothetical protein